MKIDQDDLKDWQAAYEVLKKEKGDAYVSALIQRLHDTSKQYWNTSLVEFDIDVDKIQKSSELIRFNAAQIVNRASTHGSELGGHLSTYASCATLYDIGFAYFFKGNEQGGGDLVLFQGHASPGIYARSFLEGRLTKKQLEYFRRESSGQGISSYPHPWLMPSYWQFPTVSMGLGPLQGIYHARLLKYLYARGLLLDQDRTVWVFCGDGEMDEVESLGALGVASREGLDNLIFVVNCNLVRLDGPCRGNASVLQELASYFEGFGWKVIKLVWSSAWLDLVQKDTTQQLQTDLMKLLDGEIQAMYADPKGLAQWFKGKPYESLVASWSEEDFQQLVAGGHDPQLVANAYQTAKQSLKPVVILVMSEKGHLLPDVASSNRSHNQKSLSSEQLSGYLQRLKTLDSSINTNDFYHPDQNHDSITFLQQSRSSLGGYLPNRHTQGPELKMPNLEHYQPLLDGDKEREYSTTMAFVRFLTLSLRDQNIKKYIVPIIADEGRTLGMEGLFRQIGIYAPMGQQYVPHDAQQVSSYKESTSGQLLQEGINEAGATTSWLCAATSYSVNQLTLIPFYAYYSMFGFQRVGDLIWAAADSRARGFLMGATAGRTTLGGEGLQHNDGTSHLYAAMIPNCRSYDPCYGYELAVILQHGMVEMYENQKDVFYYVTIMNENYLHPAMPKGKDEDMIKGIYLLDGDEGPQADILASGTILREAEAAVEILRASGISIRLWSVTSWSEAARHAKDDPEFLQLDADVVIAVSDYVKAVPHLLTEYIQKPYHMLGTDGFGMSDTRQALRNHFGVSKQAIVEQVKKVLGEQNG